MTKSKRMRSLGRKGGLAGGPARARTLAPQRRAEIAQRAARARWGRPVRTGGRPLTHDQLVGFVAHHGSSVASEAPVPQLERLAIRAVRASRRDSALARMLPVFFWRIRTCISIAELVREAQEQGAATATGFFLEMASQLGGSAVFDAALTALRPGVTSRPAYFFQGTASRPFERLAADLNTTPEARRWGWLMNMPRDSFESYFRKVAAL